MTDPTTLDLAELEAEVVAKRHLYSPGEADRVLALIAAAKERDELRAERDDCQRRLDNSLTPGARGVDVETIRRELIARTEERDAVEAPMTEICELLGCDDCDDAPGAVRALTAERDALARHIEKLSAPITDEEAQTAWAEFENAQRTMKEVLAAFVLRRQAAGQFAALS